MSGKKKKNSWRNRIICLVAEILAVIALLLVLSQNFGFGYQITVWVNQLIKPAVKELDITGINSSYAVLMQTGSGRVVGDINGETPMYPASMTKIMTTIVAIENLSDLNQEITVTNDMIANLMHRIPHRLEFSHVKQCRRSIFTMVLCCHQEQTAVLHWQIQLRDLKRDLWS